MKGFGQLLNVAAREALGKLKEIAPESPVTVKLETLLEVADETGIKPSGRLPNAAGENRRAMLVERIAERDREDAEATRLYLENRSMLEVGRMMGGKSQAWVASALARTGTPTRPKGPHHGHNVDLKRVERIRAARKAGKTLEQIGAAEHISRERVRQICSWADIDTSPNLELSDEQKAAVAEYEAGASLNSVAVKYGVGSSAIRNWVVRAGHVPRREPTRRDSAETKRKAAKAARLYRAGLRGREIAAEMGFAKPETIYRYLAIAGIKPDRQPTSGRHGLRQ